MIKHIYKLKLTYIWVFWLILRRIIIKGESIIQSLKFCNLEPIKVSKEERGGSLGVLDAELESTEDPSSEDHSVDTDDNVELGEETEELNICTRVE